MQRILKTHFDVNGFDEHWLASLQRTLNSPKVPERALQFKKEWALMITDDLISPAEYEKLTDEDFDSQTELVQWLKEVWVMLYGQEEIS